MGLNLKPWQTLIPADVKPGQTYFQLIQADFIDTDTKEHPSPCNNASTNVYVRTEDEKGNYLAGIKVYQEYPDGKPFQVTRPKGELDYCGELWGTALMVPGSHGGDGGGSFDPAKPGAKGPYTFYPEGLADKIAGCGIELNQHQQQKLVWRKVVEGVVAPPTGKTLEQTVLEVESTYPRIPINTDAALYKYAQAHSLGQAQGDEHHFQWQDAEYIFQTFNGGIVYCPLADVNAVVVISK